jgi:thiamine pyrophosphokinase
MMKRDLFVGGNLDPSLRRHVPWDALFKSSQRIFFVDKGFEVYDAQTLNGHKQLYYFGDGDSISNEAKKDLSYLESSHIHRFSKQKDFSDSSAALLFSQKNKSKTTDALFIGMSEGRPDHMMGNLFEWLFLQKGKCWEKMWVLGAESQLLFFTGHLNLKLPLGTPCAAYNNPYMASQSELSITGLKYSLKNEILKSPTHGISNITIDELVSVKTQDGHIFMVMLPIEKFPINNLML